MQTKKIKANLTYSLPNKNWVNHKTIQITFRTVFAARWHDKFERALPCGTALPRSAPVVALWASYATVLSTRCTMYKRTALPVDR